MSATMLQRVPLIAAADDSAAAAKPAIEDLGRSRTRPRRRLCIVTDAWRPQTNGVVTCLENMIREMECLNVACTVVHPGLFRSLALPGYDDLRLAIDVWRLRQVVRFEEHDAIHIATEGPLGWMARRVLLRSRRPFTSAVHTKFPEYLNVRTGIPASLGYAVLRRFHAAGQSTFVQTESQRRELAAFGFKHLAIIGGGVDVERFSPAPNRARARRPHAEPVLLFVGRVAVEKNIEAFLDLDCPGDKRVVGDGPALASLRERYPEATFVGRLQGDALVQAYRDADVLVFPSLTDTFGLVMIEAMACGTPVAAFPVTGPRDVVEDGVTGAVHENLAIAIERALRLDRAHCRSASMRFAWQAVTERFVDGQAWRSGAESPERASPGLAAASLR